MKNLEEIAQLIEEELDEKDTLREIALKSSRAIIRLSGASIKAMHNQDDPTGLLGEAKDEASKLRGLVMGHPDLVSAGFIEDAYQELAEAFILYSIMTEQEFPSPQDIEITSTSFLMGMGDVVGELRRSCLDCLRRGDLHTATVRLEQMEAIFETIVRFDYPSALVGIRRKQDIARTLIEKTRGEVTLASRSQRLEEQMEKVSKELRAAKKTLKK
ncbi:MAG: translin family protein [Candidatus Thermoplasmatota archaeon]|nr:translin family protein [Candidatus Thermoplasmatota archaeon]